MAALAPDHLESRIGTVRALRVEDHYGTAERLCRRLMDRVPDDHRPRAEYARCAHDADDLTEAESRWHGALLRHHGRVSVALGLAQTLTAQNRFAEARALLDRLAGQQPHRAEPLVALARNALLEGNLKAAQVASDRLLAAHPRGLDHLLLRGRLLELQLDYRGAATWYRDLALDHPGSLEPRLAMGELAQRQAELTGAIKAFRGVLA